MRHARGPLAAVLTTAALGLGLTACGGSEDGGTSGGSAGGGSAGGGSPTAQLFAQSCGSCHTFAAAGTDGGQGPDLDEIGDGVEEVRAKIQGGGGGMPAFGSQLSAEQIDALADYVVDERQ